MEGGEEKELEKELRVVTGWRVERCKNGELLEDGKGRRVERRENEKGFEDGRGKDDGRK